jgi:outer membrane protein assembly factor BamB
VSRRRVAVIVAVVLLAAAVPGALVARKAAGLRRLGTPVRLVTSTAPPPAPLDTGPGAAPIHWTITPEGRITDVAVLPAKGLVVYVEEVSHRSWRATAVDAHTGRVRWSNAREHTGHIEAWTVTDAAVVLAYHHSASRLAWRLHKAASFEGLDPLSGKVRWTRHVYNLLGERPGDYAPTLASPAENMVYARTEFGVPNAVDTRTGRTLWEYPGLNDCRAHEIVAGPGGVAISQRCPQGKERVALVNPHTGKAIWRFDISTPSLRLLGVGTDSVAVYQGGLVQQVIVFGPGGVEAGRIPCDCGDGAALDAVPAGGTVLAAGPAGRIGVGGSLTISGPFGVVDVDGATGKILGRTPGSTGPDAAAAAGEPYRAVVSAGGLSFTGPVS